MQLNRRFIRCSLSLSRPSHRMNPKSLNKSGAEGRRGKNTENRVSFRSRVTRGGVKSEDRRCLLYLLNFPAVVGSCLVLKAGSHSWSCTNPKSQPLTTSASKLVWMQGTTTIPYFGSLDQLLIYFPFILQHELFLLARLQLKRKIFIECGLRAILMQFIAAAINLSPNPSESRRRQGNLFVSILRPSASQFFCHGEGKHVFP